MYLPFWRLQLRLRFIVVYVTVELTLSSIAGVGVYFVECTMDNELTICPSRATAKITLKYKLNNKENTETKRHITYNEVY